MRVGAESRWSTDRLLSDPCSFPNSPHSAGCFMLTVTPSPAPFGSAACARGLTPRSVLWSFAALTMLWQAAPALAQSTTTWTGGGANGNWATAANWASGTIPSASSPFNYVMQGTTKLSSTNAASGRQAASIVFQSGAGAFSIFGGSFALAGPISNLSSSTQTINSAISTTALRTVNTGSATIVFAGVLSGAGGGLNVTGAGTAVFNALNTYTGTTVVASGATVTGTGRLPRLEVQSGGVVTPGNGTLLRAAHDRHFCRQHGWVRRRQWHGCHGGPGHLGDDPGRHLRRIQPARECQPVRGQTRHQLRQRHALQRRHDVQSVRHVGHQHRRFRCRDRGRWQV
ncbi:MAG: hypothetical protein EBR86_09570 [Planctomycetia bacterium]|nr:hypothetical protein [Planctomycetia bacterium]